jgi:hypothetical protein
LNAGIGASGPHDFAVRNSVARPRAERATTPPRPPHPIPCFVTIAIRPSVGGAGRDKLVIFFRGQANE